MKRGAKLADFGTVRLVPELAQQGSKAPTHHSTKHVVGTGPYMPPEYVQYGHVSAKTDTYAYGVVLLETMDHIKPGCVEWGRVNRNCKMVFKKIENANYAVDLGLKTFKFSLVGIGGKDIQDGNVKLVLASDLPRQ